MPASNKARDDDDDDDEQRRNFGLKSGGANSEAVEHGNGEGIPPIQLQRVGERHELPLPRGPGELKSGRKWF